MSHYSREANRELLVKTYRDTHALLLDFEKYQADFKVFSTARTTAYQEAQKIKADLEKALQEPTKTLAPSLPLAELSASLPDLESNLDLISKTGETGSEEEAHFWLAAAETARAEAEGKHLLVQELADRYTVFSAALAKRSTAIEGFREQELESATQADHFERELQTIERKLEILGMTKTVGVILREQTVRLPSAKTTQRSLVSIAELTGESSLRQMELLDERRQLRNVQSYVDKLLAPTDAPTRQSIGSDLLQLTMSRKDLVSRATDVEVTYARALTDLDFSVHRLAIATQAYRVFISERPLWAPTRQTGNSQPHCTWHCFARHCIT